MIVKQMIRIEGKKCKAPLYVMKESYGISIDDIVTAQPMTGYSPLKEVGRRPSREVKVLAATPLKKEK